MYGYYSYDNNYLIFMIISFIVSMYSHLKVQHAFNKYSKIKCSKGISGSESAKIVLNHNGIDNVRIERTRGYFTDFFDSRSNRICLSDQVYSDATIASVSVAAHESGHAIQHSKNYFPLRLRHALVPITQIGSNLSMPLIFLGLLVPSWGFAINLGILLFSFAVIFQIVTLPVEFNASNRALQSIKDTSILSDEEMHGAKEVLQAAALTYVASTFTALLSLFRLILMSRNRRR